MNSNWSLHVGEDLLDVGLETHVDHPVCLIHHNVGAAGQHQIPVGAHQAQHKSKEQITTLKFSF